MTAPLHPINSYPNRLSAHIQFGISGLLAIVCFLALGVTAFATPAKFDIPTQPAPEALQLFIKQSGTQVMFVADEVKALSVNAVVGEYEPAEAMERLLKGTGYTATERKSGWFSHI